MEKQEAQEKAEFPKELLVVAPLLGSAVAVSFDVGYFSGLDINLFTLFSITEHIVFALEASPGAFGFAVFVTILLATGTDKKRLPSWGRPRERSRVEAAAVSIIILLGLGYTFYLTGLYAAIAFFVGGIITSWLRSAHLNRSTLLASSKHPLRAAG